MTQPKRTCRKSNGYVKHKKFSKPLYYSGHQGGEKKGNRNTYNISSVKRVIRKFVEVSRYGRAKQGQRYLHKKVCCTCKVVFFFFCSLGLLIYLAVLLPSPRSTISYFVWLNLYHHSYWQFLQGLVLKPGLDSYFCHQPMKQRSLSKRSFVI